MGNIKENKKEDPIQKIVSFLNPKQSSAYTPRTLASAYLSFKEKNEDSDLPLTKASSLARLIKECMSHNAEDEVIKPFRESLSEMRHTVFYDRLPSGLITDLKNYYQEDAINSIADAIIDFEDAIFLVDKAKKLVTIWKGFEEPARKTSLAVVQACKLILHDGFLSDEQKVTINDIKSSHELLAGKRIQLKIDVVGAVQHYENLFQKIGVDEKAYLKRRDNQLLAFYFYKLCFSRGRPHDVFIKALILVIYHLLTKTMIPHPSPNKSWVKNFVANTINRCYQGKGLRELKEKDVDNALHST
jgi:hypothetical protein